jgi:diguanylate cyclase (GGDEF)-like protein
MGTVLYATNDALTGDRVAIEGGLATALGGDVHSELETVADSPEEVSSADVGSVLEVYVPVSMQTGDDGRGVVGVFEIYVPYDVIAAGVDEDVRALHLWLIAGLLVVWAGLFRLMATAARRQRVDATENERLVQHDPLTGLPNRALFVERAAQAVVAVRRDGSHTAVLITNLDNFKEINDTLGHHVGDKLMAAVAKRLAEPLREVDTVARLGGDEFAILLARVDGPRGAKEAAERLLANLRRPHLVDGLLLEVSATVGVSLCPAHGRDVSQLLRCADVALSSAKEERRSVVVYDAALDANTPARLALYGELRRAIDEHELVMHYQPLVNLSTGTVTGVEALVRWSHPGRGLLAPDQFVPLAEHTGLVRPMTLAVLRMALRQCREWRDAGHELTMAVNLSVRSLLDHDLPSEVWGVLQEMEIPADALELEITETTAMVDPARAMAVMSQLRALGIHLSIDDYGTGHSSLSYLNRLPVDTLKIDRSFVAAMDDTPHNATIVRSTIDLGRNLGLRVLAEGVETEATWERLTQLGCDYAQGYWLARPQPADTLLSAVAALERRLAAAAQPAIRSTTPSGPGPAAAGLPRS